MRNKGVTLVELLIAMGITIITFSLISAAYLVANRLWRGGLTQVTFQSRGRISLRKIATNLRSSTGVTILQNGDRIRFVLDPNRTPEITTDDITSEYYIVNTDIMHDPDLSIGGDEVTLLSDVYKEAGIPIFQNSGNLIVITFKLYNSDAVYGTYWSSISTSVKMRNI